MKIKMNNAVGPQVRSAKPKAGKLLPTLGVLSLAGGLQAATQYFAHTFDYQASLGGHIGHLCALVDPAMGVEVVQPLSQRNMSAGSVGMLVSTVGLLGVAIAKVVASNTSKANQCLHGSARWAEKKDIQAAGLLPRPRTVLEVVTGKEEPTATGVYVGGWEDKDGSFYYLRHSGPEHVLCYAPTRSGKGVGLVVPTMLSWPASAVITDLKGELWALTAGWRKKHAKNKVLRFEPASSNGGICWNHWTKSGWAPNLVTSVQNLAQLIVDPDGKRH